MEYRSLSGRRYPLIDKQVGKGGEGRIFEVADDSRLVAKLYEPAYRTACRESKLRAMLQIPLPPELDAQLAWPRDVLYDPMGRPAGFIMRRICGTPLSALCADESLDSARRITLAKNLCVVFHQIHSVSLVIGDVNGGNVLVSGAGLLNIIDTDSFHIEHGGRVFPCEVHVPEYLCPAVANAIPKGESLKTAPLPTFTRQSDEYALAVLLFQLLMHAHPFSVALAAGNHAEQIPRPSELMRKYAFPYENCPYGLQLPVYALPWRLLPERLRFMFITVFSKGGTIPAARWYEALCDFERENTGICKADPRHRYRKGLRKCPYCAAIKRKEAFFKKQRK